MKSFVTLFLFCLSLMCQRMDGSILLDTQRNKLQGDKSQRNKLQGDKYFQEREFGGTSRVIPIEKELFSCQSDFQKIEVLASKEYGNVFVLDDIIQLTQYDNFAYHEMIAHVPLLVHPNPLKVLIVGGGDGGTLKEVLKHCEVEEIVLCDIDREVIATSKKYFPEFAKGFDDPRVTVEIGDATVYIKNKQHYFDVIIVDSTDAFGVAEKLFCKEFYQDLQCALTDDGIAVTQSESLYYDQDLIRNLLEQNKEIFTHAFYYFTLVPTYPSGTIGFSFCSNTYDPFGKLDSNRIACIKDLNYYNQAIHKASFQLPQFICEAISA